jgi:RNA polymerase sigma-70 factor, ECF subfamily
MSRLSSTSLKRTPTPERAPIGDIELIDGVLAGDAASFGLIVERYGERLFRLVHGILGDWHRSEDVVQEVFILVHRKLSGFDRRASLLTWLYRIAVNAALKARRRARRQAFSPVGEEWDVRDAGPQVGRELEMKELADKLLRCLPAKLRAVVLLREWEGLTYEEISVIIGCSRGAVEQRLHRAMVELRRTWRPAGREEWLHGV